MEEVGPSQLVLVAAQHQVLGAVPLDYGKKWLDGIRGFFITRPLEAESKPDIAAGSDKLPEDGGGSGARGDLYRHRLPWVYGELVLRGTRGLGNELASRLWTAPECGRGQR